jgi:hypothetical protein
MIIARDPPSPPEVFIEFGLPPAKPAVVEARQERARRNDAWIQAHWGEIAPQARGKYVAVAGAQAFLAEIAEKARALARAAHPDDDTVTVYFISPKQGPRVYANRW